MVVDDGVSWLIVFWNKFLEKQMMNVTCSLDLVEISGSD